MDDSLRQGGEGTASSGDTHVVQPNETLGQIAERYGVTLAALRERNPGLVPTRMRVGQEIVVGDERRTSEYVVREGDTLGAIAKRFGVPVEEILRLHPKLVPARIQPGQVLRVRTKLPASWSRSIGMPSQGKLVHGRRLPTHHAYVIRERNRAWGTDETVDALVTAFDALRAKHPRAPRIEVHDISLQHGGPINDHKSHESGRDVDIALFRNDCRRGVCAFQPSSADGLDAKRQWALLHHWLDRDRVEAIFVDYRLQAPLWREARAAGATEAELRRWFQYPNGPGYPLGIIRHFRKHDDHLHVRFACHDTDPECRSFRPLQTRHASRD